MNSRNQLGKYRFSTLRDCPEQMEIAARWFHSKWRVPEEAYCSCMTAYLNRETEYGWYLCFDGERIVGGLGVIENDFHDRRDLTPNVCAVYTEEDHRGRGVAGRLLNMAVEDLRAGACRRCTCSPITPGFTSDTAGSFSAWRRARARQKCRECIFTAERNEALTRCISAFHMWG